jgi:hypothetical protein
MLAGALKPQNNMVTAPERNKRQKRLLAETAKYVK